MDKLSFTETPTPIHFFNKFYSNHIYIKRDDCTDLALGGNKARKLEYFLADAIEKKANCIVTYGAPQSNHCRLTAAAASKLGLKTLLILSKTANPTFDGNYFLYKLFDVEIIWTDVEKVSETIEHTLKNLGEKGYNPYFIQGGGHGNLGTHAYKKTFDEILEQQKDIQTNFEYIFHASGTGTTQAGLIAGKLINDFSTNIVGISVARNNKRGKEVIYESLIDYFDENGITIPPKLNEIIFEDSYVGKGYAHIYPEIVEIIKKVAKKSGILLDPVYTGKAFYGMLEYIKKHEIMNKDILFIHTGGTPLLFNYADKFEEE
ncbi:D-cysteine desulfhydrase family protein [Pseudogracilibacillus sp. SE30717A]|uniref:1-aminocyclopropane-1-carboxylate deaminase/D-cysteine desulfhydrase n=1 Tax=Pseudogracilibacillus sp. SE30717A TaxID=3098293 RepID=UPI00300DCB76